jgi:hypothetical protein
MAAKRFTDSSKWRNEWFRTLPWKAKLAWIYICDECDYCGLWKADFGLASFQLGFPVNAESLNEWFGDKIHLLKTDHIFITQFFEFQYGLSKDTWTAKINAKNKIEALGFKVENNKVIISSSPQSPHCTPTKSHSGPLVLIEGIVKGEGEVEGRFKNSCFDFEKAFEKYPVRIKGPNAEDRFLKQIHTQAQFDDLVRSIDHYNKFLALPQNDYRSPKQSWETYLGTKSSGYFWKSFISHECLIVAEQPRPVVSLKSEAEELTHSIFSVLKKNHSRWGLDPGSFAVESEVPCWIDGKEYAATSLQEAVSYELGDLAANAIEKMGGARDLYREFAKAENKTFLRAQLRNLVSAILEKQQSA